MNHDRKRPVTLEDLLLLKRAERPPAEFWTTFDRDLRAKQLAALVEKRPWWRTFPRVFAGFSRYHLPLGATAIVAITFFSVREYRAVALVQSNPRPQGAPVVAVAGAPVASTFTPAAEPVRETIARPAVTVEQVAVATPAARATSSESARIVPVVALLDENTAGGLTPSARLIAANFAAPSDAPPFLRAARGFEMRGFPARAAAVEPLAQIALSERRRSRQNAGAMPAVFNTYSADSEKIARQISDERLYETVSRMSARGDRLNFKL